MLCLELALRCARLSPMLALHLFDGQVLAIRNVERLSMRTHQYVHPSSVVSPSASAGIPRMLEDTRSLPGSRAALSY